MAQTRQGKPPPGVLINTLKAKAAIEDAHPAPSGTGPLFGIRRADGRLRWCRFAGSIDMAQQEIEMMASKFTRYANQLEPGHYYELYSREPELEGYTGDADCTINQRRKQARDVAFMAILDGPDTKTRRWLEKYLAKIHPPEKDKGPVPVGDAIEI